eukprot:PITA_20513
MSFYGLRLEYALEGSSNYIAWKDRMEVVLEENKLKEFIDHDILKPPTSDAKDLAEWTKCVENARRIILEGVRDHIILNIHGKETPFSMWKALRKLFQNSSDHTNLALKDKLKKIKMEKGDTIPKYLTKFTQCRDELGSVNVNVEKDDLVILALLGLPKSWQSYQDSVNELEEDFALVSKENKDKGNKSQGKEGRKKKDLLNIKCFPYHKFWNYATKFPHKKARKKEHALAAVSEVLTSQFELDFTLIECMENTIMGSMWYLDNGASFHMMGNRDIFNYLEEKDLKHNIEFGDDGRYSVTNIGTVTF